MLPAVINDVIGVSGQLYNLSAACSMFHHLYPNQRQSQRCCYLKRRIHNQLLLLEEIAFNLASLQES